MDQLGGGGGAQHRKENETSPVCGLARPVDLLKCMYLVVFVLDYCVAYYFDISLSSRGILQYADPGPRQSGR